MYVRERKQYVFKLQALFAQPKWQLTLQFQTRETLFRFSYLSDSNRYWLAEINDIVVDAHSFSNNLLWMRCDTSHVIMYLITFACSLYMSK